MSQAQPVQSIPYFDGKEPAIQYWEAYRFLFTSPNGWTNLLLCGVCMLIPIVGPMVVTGFVVSAFLPRLNDSRGAGVACPEFDFNRFTDYLTRGIWPLLVSLVAGLLLAIPVMLCGLLFVAGIVVAQQDVAVGIVLLVAGMVLFLGSILFMNMLLVPLQLRAALLGEFAPAFDFRWSKDFVARTWRELMLAALFGVATAFPIGVIGYACCIVGVYAAMALIVVAQWHLHFQVYRLYIARGGAALASKWTPPPLPSSRAPGAVGTSA